jgi:mono/diheme cytochrome c family protein
MIRLLPAVVLLSFSLGAAAQDVAAGMSDAVKRGEYLSMAGNCEHCHTVAGGAPFAGGVAFPTEFGVIYSTNITPHEEAGIGQWSEEDFVRAMHEGIAADGTKLYPAFPYPSFTKVTEADLKDIFTFLKSVPASSATPPENDLGFPFNQRGLMGVWNALFFESGRYQPNAEKSDQWNRGAYLVEGLGHCGSCHTPRNFLGGKDESRALSGGTYNDTVAPGKIRPWSAVNLTSAPDGMAAWTEEDIAKYLKTGHSDAAGTFGPMNAVITDSTSHLTEADVRAMAAYISDLEPIERAPSHEMSADDFRDGELIYTIHCGTCHLPTGLGDPSIGPMLAGSSVVQAEDPASLINSIIYGAVVPSPAPPHAWETMEAFGDKLDDDEIALLSTYMRANWGNRGGPVSEAQVEAQR